MQALLLSLLFACAFVQASDASRLDVYVRTGCPHCEDAERFLTELTHERPDVEITLHVVDRDPAARDALISLSRAADIWPPGVPTFVANGRVHVGFDAANGADAVRALLAATPDAAAVDAPIFGRLTPDALGLPLFALTLGLIDGFNPCATWVLLFLLSLLVRMRSRRRMAVVAGTFVVTSGVVYYAFMAAWLNLFLWIGLSDPVRIALALVALTVGVVDVKDFVAPGRGLSLSIPETAKPNLYARARAVLKAHSLPTSLGAVIALAVAVNFVELLCTAGLPAMFTAVLAQQDLGSAAYHDYIGLYIAGYVADDALMVTTAVWAFSSRRLGERGGRWLKLAAGVVMLALGMVMLFRPAWLA